MKVCKEGVGEGWFLEQVGWNLGSGDKVRFWEDVWVGNSTLKTPYNFLSKVIFSFSKSRSEGGRGRSMG